MQSNKEMRPPTEGMAAALLSSAKTGCKGAFRRTAKLVVRKVQQTKWALLC